MTRVGRTVADEFVKAAITASLFMLWIAPQAIFPQAQPGPTVAQPRAFLEPDAVGVMDRLRQALEGESRSRALKLFDTARMPGYAAFRDEVIQFFEQYQSPRVQYRVSQVSQDRGLGAIIADFTIEALPTRDGLPELHRRVQMRLVLSWDGKEWKIADLSPRSVFR